MVFEACKNNGKRRKYGRFEGLDFLIKFSEERFWNAEDRIGI